MPTSEKRQLGATVLTTLRKPRVVLVGGLGTERMTELLRSQDWEVLSLPACDDLACTIAARKPTVVVLPVRTGWESGYLVAAKLRAAKRKLRVVLVAPSRTEEAERFSRFVGAVLVTEGDSPTKLAHAVTG